MKNFMHPIVVETRLLGVQSSYVPLHSAFSRSLVVLSDRFFLGVPSSVLFFVVLFFSVCMFQIFFPFRWGFSPVALASQLAGGFRTDSVSKSLILLHSTSGFILVVDISLERQKWFRPPSLKHVLNFRVGAPVEMWVPFLAVCLSCSTEV